MVLSLLFAMLATVCSGRVSTVNSRTCVIDMCHPRESLQPYRVPSLAWQPVSQDLFELNGLVLVLVTVDHYSDFLELDQPPTIQSSAVTQANKQHISRHGISQSRS